MSISEVIKQARVEADLSQESAAEKIGVSRQTLSNWENGKNYPDIISLVALSDTYNISLDSLMRGDKKMMAHLEENTNIRKSNKQVIATIIAIAIALIGTALTILALGGDYWDFVDLPSWIALIIPMLAVLTITRSFRTFGVGIQTLLFPKKKIDDGLKKQAASLFRLLSKTAILSGIIVSLIGLVNMLLGIDFSHEEAINYFAVNFAINMMTILYSLFLIVFIFEPIVYILKKNRDL